MDAGYQPHTNINGFSSGSMNYASTDAACAPLQPERTKYHHPPPDYAPDTSSDSILKFKLATLESQLAERHKDIITAQTTISELLKISVCLAARSGSQDCGGLTASSVKGDSLPIMAQTFKDIIIAMAEILCTVAGKVQSGSSRFSSISNKMNPAVGDLLGSSAEDSGWQALPAEKKPPASLDPIDYANEGCNAGPPKDHARNGPEDSVRQPEAQQLDGVTVKQDNFAAIPYVTRFGQSKIQAMTESQVSTLLTAEEVPVDEASCDDVFTSVKQIIPEQDLNAFLSSLPNSDSDLGGSTRYGSSGSTGFTSPNSSFTSSEDEVRGSVENTAEHDHIQGPVSGGPSGSSNSCSFSGRQIHDWPSPTVSSLTALHLNPNDTPQLSSSVFMPKWPKESFAFLPAERQSAIATHQQLIGEDVREDRFPEFFKHGLRYRANPMRADACRTVIVDDLPRSITISALLQHIRGGAVADAKLLNTISISGKMSAMIVFVHGSAAQSFEARARQYTLSFAGSRARVTLLPTPTWPMRDSHYRSTIDHAHTRCLGIQNFPRHIPPAQLERDLCIHPAMNIHRIEAKKMHSDHTLELRFTSIKYAQRAYGRLSNLLSYKQCTTKPLPDPCARPWENHREQPTVAVLGAKPNTECLKLDLPPSTPAEATIPCKEDNASLERKEALPNADLIDLGKVESPAEQISDEDNGHGPKVPPSGGPILDRADKPWNACHQQ